mmetsp:Transcript_33158/g.54731  ORF Transcript_33158/g.54731 Transcript_33158/m.54731 type:complete len:422 (+) Transcript_33158:156-1421(+)|eukprot:CAMPEP_0119010444 /NCGR_PEP_ID=MMETSP1176-20130426/5010_1 /TAXON_ID=265551 /ORGANISM="Synedropsis recta cf, Strain CCMP1620" /LENGTH=421 /DNA_ID=CAMNT_0006963097 /DNA_START=117 /DNA_END=1382 /DNA_ORIENTATION=+
MELISRRSRSKNPELRSLLDDFDDEPIPEQPQQQQRSRSSQQQTRNNRRPRHNHNESVPVQYNTITHDLAISSRRNVPYRDGPQHQRRLVHNQHQHEHQTTLKQSNPAPDLAIPFLSRGMCCCQCVRTQEIGLTEKFGRFDQLLSPGLYILSWPYEAIAARLSLRIQQLDIVCETKTQDHVFVHLSISIQYRVLPTMAYQAHYQIADITKYIQAQVLHIVRSTVPTNLSLDQVFCQKHTISRAIEDSLSISLEREFGYELIHTLCTNVEPVSSEVKRSMNEVEACRRIKLAVPHKAEANKIQEVKKAEGHAEALYLNGLGTSNERRSIAKGMYESALDWSAQEMDFGQVVDLLLVTQYMDVLSGVSANAILVRPDPGELLGMRGLLGDDDSTCAGDSSEGEDEREFLIFDEPDDQVSDTFA